MANRNTFPINGFSDSLLVGQSILDVFVLQDILDINDAEKLKKTFRTNREIENYLVRNHLVTIETVNKAYSILLKLPYISLANVEIPEEAIKLVPQKLAERYGIVPFNVKDRLVRIAVSRPADLLTKYPESLAHFFQQNNLAIELFITGDSDFRACIKQYDRRKKRSLLLKKGSLPIVFLRNQIIPQKYLKKFPKDFIEKYRIVVFGQNDSGDYLIACETFDSPLTKRIIGFIQTENNIKVESFTTSKEDIKFALSQYDKESAQETKLDVGYRQNKNEKDKKPQDSGDNNNGKIQIRGFLGSIIGNGHREPEFTIDDYPRLTNFEGQVEKRLELKSAQELSPAPRTERKEEVFIDQDKKKEGQTGKLEKMEIGKPISESDSQNNPKQQSVLDSSQESKYKGFEAKDLGSLLGGKEIKNGQDLESVVGNGYIPKIVAGLIGFSLSQKASDVHIEPGIKYLRVRYRIDGILQDVVKIPMNLHPPVISRIKILSRLKIDETRIPQDGRFDVIFNGRNVDVRVSILPTVHGEKIVLRILDKDKSLLSLEDLGMKGSAFDLTIKAVNKPFGIILSTGPTGSGKSTTLYAVINRLSVPGINIVTLEDPVEYEISGINQCQVKPEIGFTFASGLRSVLRQDPNVIMVGEIRDAETAGMATHAALTGHLVLSTLHTNDAAGALPRLTNMGIEPFLITSSMNLVIGQRLIRRICLKCREEVKVPPKLLEDIKTEISRITSKDPKDLLRIPNEVKLYYGKGCSECTNGFKGRIGLFEVMELNSEIEELAVAKRPASEIRNAAVRNGMITMKQDGILKALEGLTTIDEVLQATTNN